MPEGIDIQVASNIGLLDATAFNHQLKTLVDNAVAHALHFLRAREPKRTGEMERHTSRTRVEEVAEFIQAAVGVSRITSVARTLPRIPGLQSPENYPLYVDRGTGMFGPLHQPIVGRSSPRLLMKFQGNDGWPIYTHSVTGQRPQNFMFATYVEMRADIEGALHELGVKATRPGGLFT